MPRLDEEQINRNVYENSLHTCEYISGYVNRASIIKVKCLIHDHVFETAYENVARKTRAHHICPLCQQEDFNKNKILLTCDYCGKEYYIPQSRLEHSEFHFCSRDCKDKAQRLSSGEQFEKLRPDHYGQGNGVSSYRSKAFQQYEHKCSVCGWSEDENILEVHHIDEDRSHNNIDNLIILCPICHRKITNHQYELIDRHTIVKKKED